MRLEGISFEESSDYAAEFVIYGQVHGVAGTDHLRRDLSVALLWGIPIALVFGLIAAVGTSILTMIIAAVGVWYGGWVDELIQRITEVNLVLPFLSILVMVGTFYSKSLWVIFGRDRAAEHFWRRDQNLPGEFYANQRIYVYRSCPGLWGKGHSDHLFIPDPTHCPASDPGVGFIHSKLCVP